MNSPVDTPVRVDPAGTAYTAASHNLTLVAAEKARRAVKGRAP